MSMIDLNTLRQKKDEIIFTASQYGATNLRVFGSVARGQSNPNDIDFLVKMKKGVSLFDCMALEEKLEKQLGLAVHIAVDDALLSRSRDHIFTKRIALMIEDDNGYLQDILQAVADIQSFIGSLSHDEFRSNRMCQHAVIRNLALIGEAVKKLSTSFTSENDDISWSLMARMRDRLVHDYGGIRIDILWETAKSELPKLKIKLESLLN